MALFRRRSSRKTSPPGAWLAFLAVGIQFLLPFLVAYEIALAGSPAYADSIAVICSASGAPTADGTNPVHHGMSEGCPICAAMAVGQAFTTPGPIALPLPLMVATDGMTIAIELRAPSIGATPYQSRAPPARA